MLTFMRKSMTIQGRQLFASDIELIRRLMDEHPDWHRSRLSIELCRMWEWRTDKGLLKDMACRSMLRKLEQRQLIMLPPALRSGNRARRIRDIAHSCDPIQSSLSRLRPLEMIMITSRGETDDLLHCLMDRYHYLGCRGHVGEHIKYMVYDRHKRPLACLLFGSAAWKTQARDQFIGWSSATRQKNLKLMTNNTRFLILPWVKVTNLASFILGACLKRLRNDWQNRYDHELCLVETFVDRSRFSGTCYRAANWMRIGKTKGRSRQDRHKRLKVPIKDLYVYPLTADFKQRLCAGN
jgi:hypothetical protein